MIGVKMKKFLLISLVLFSMFFLAGCNFEMNSEIYLSDVYGLLENPELSLFVPTTIKLEIVSEDNFKQYKDRITDILSDYFGEVSNIRYEEENLSGFYVGDIEVPLLLEKSLESIVSFSVDKVGNLIMNFDEENFNVLAKTILEEFFYSFDPKDLFFNITLINDMKRDINIEVQGVYINGRPYPFLEKIVLKNRQKLVITFSNVLKDYMIREGKVSFVKIYW